MFIRISIMLRLTCSHDGYFILFVLFVCCLHVAVAPREWLVFHRVSHTGKPTKVPVNVVIAMVKLAVVTVITVAVVIVLLRAIVFSRGLLQFLAVQQHQ